MRSRRLVTAMAIVWALAAAAAGQDAPRDRRLLKDIVFAEVDGHALRLDLHMPVDAGRPPLVVWVHGGAWRSGSKDSMPLGRLVDDGYCVASVDYRLSPVAKFPAQVHDIKAAIRFLRASQEQFGYDSGRTAVAGSSAGGHLAALVGVSGGDQTLEGRVGKHLDHSSAVQAIVDYYGPANFLTILEQSTPHGLSVRVPALELLLGGQPDEKPELARLASPVLQVDAEDPPLLILHGDQDPQVPINQSHELHAACKQHKVLVRMEVVHGGVHGGALFYDDQRYRLVKEFLDQHIRRP